MRLSRRFALALALGAPLAGCGESEKAAAPGFPERAPGLWEQLSAIDGLEARGVSRVCVDSASDQTLWAFSQGQGFCALKEKKAGGAYVAECRQGGLILTNDIALSGDFKSAYEMKISTRMAAGDKATPMEKLMASSPAPSATISARRIGDCPAGIRPGDFLIDGAVVSNLVERAADLQEQD
ncbi:DUF3617 domain-containing protein [Neomegalonema perideroedes]|uniref:DUF3617 domain-containing protein n=1 Tax=Neomegalonema perideroedes TaxID=217219 RepID=UPI00037AA430|nr:DUF3617 family protein [Neomegalonema perideroedes]